MTTQIQDATRTPALKQRYYVYLNSGEVRVIANATAVDLTQDEVVIHDETRRLAVFPRRDVYFCSDDPVPPPGLT